MLFNLWLPFYPKAYYSRQNLEVVNHWGPRSKAATKVVDDYVQKHAKIDEQLKTDLQLWYNKNKGEAIIAEMQDLALCEKNSEVM